MKKKFIQYSIISIILTISACNNSIDSSKSPTTDSIGNNQSGMYTSDTINSYSNSKEMHLDPFNEIEINCNANITYKTNEAPSIKITSDEETLKHLIVNVIDNKLCIKMDNNNRSYDNISININGTSKLEEIDIAGACVFSAIREYGGFSPHSLDIDCSGASTLLLNDINCSKLDIDCTGASNILINNINCKEIDVMGCGGSKIILAGKATSAKYEASGSSLIEATNFNATKILKEMATGASKIKK